MYSVKGVSLKALSCALPEQKFSLREYAPDLIDEKTARQIENVNGFHTLRIAHDEMTTSDLCFASAKECISNLWGGVRHVSFLGFFSYFCFRFLKKI